MKFRLIFETITKNGKKVQIKFKIPPSKHLGLINFMKIALEQGDDVHFFVEKLTDEKRELSKVEGKFKLVPSTPQDKVEIVKESPKK
jgi:hypothetical protein